MVSLLKNPTWQVGILSFSGGIFVFLMMAATSTAPLSTTVFLLVLLIWSLFVIMLASFLFRRRAMTSLADVGNAHGPSVSVATRTIEPSVLGRLQYAVDQHSIVSKTDVAGRIIYVNDLFEKVCGFQRDELLGKTHSVIKSDKHTPEFFTDMWQTISQGRIWHGEVCNQRKNGEYYWVESTIVPFVDNNGKPFEYISVRTDISTIKKYEQALVHAKNEAEEASNVKSKFLSNISHELRTPLNAILGFTQVLEMEESIVRENRTYLNEIGKAGKYLVSLFDDLLDLGCVENGSLSLNTSQVCLYDILNECINLTSMIAMEQGISLHPEIEGCSHLDIVVDRKRLKQVVLNLLTNAIKYNSPNGSVILKCNQTNSQELMIEVVDTGFGMTADDIQKIFQPFIRVGDKQTNIRGAGVGLALSKRIMQQMGGDILVHSIIGQGSRFCISLPYEAANQSKIRQLSN